ncbi:MAG: DNA gyrase/topoisomerase IV subunit A [Flavobacteriales bacterium]|jgi:topoisomerase-4 subunit A|nr:DNA gyrase/topoisomerase IV subunit A [Flavobacteriales bacterium]
MSIENENEFNEDAFDENDTHSDGVDVIPLSGLYEDWFLDYASYVILERAVPALEDGLKPVQRRILHSLKELDDGRYNKVANVIGNTMKYHPHGDASIGDAMVQIGQKDLLIDCQGNWGNTLTGDGAAAPRYIEARLTKFALHTVFNPKTTEWLSSYDGRNKEPKNLPIKFPLLLSQGAEGIAVGMACKILPHNFIELIDASIDYLRGRKVDLYPDFPHGGKADFSNYNGGLRGGKVRVRANITKVNAKTLMIDQIPYGTTTDSLMDSIVKANDKNKIKVRKIEDNTAAEAEILIHLPAGVSPDKMIDALYAFTNCEISISPNAAVIEEGNKPVFISVNEMLKNSTDRTVELLKLELEIKKRELESQWHWASLERIFIENRIYRDIEEEETWEGVVGAIDKGMHQYISTPNRKNKAKGVVELYRDLTEEDIVRLTEIKIKRISKFDSNKADEVIAKILAGIEEVQHHLDNLVQYAVDYFRDLKNKFGEGRERKTEIRTFDSISAKKVIVSNKKLYVNKEEGFIGWTLRKDEFVSECSEIDDVIVFFKTGKMLVTKVADKKFVGKGIIHCAVWKKGDKRTIYHMIYQDGKDKVSYMKRFHVSSITRDKEYDLTTGSKGSKLLYFTANPNGRREVVSVKLRPRPHLKKIRFEIDFGELLIKGRGSKGNRATKELISKVEQKEVGGSTLAARKVWWDSVVRRLNDEGRGTLLGEFRGDDKILTLHESGHYKLSGFELATKFGDGLIHIEKWYPERPIACVYWNQEKELYYVKRFLAESSTKPVLFISEEEGAHLVVATTQKEPKIQIVYNKHLKETKHLPDKFEHVNELIDIKGLKAQGNQLTKLKVKSIALLPPEEGEEWEVEEVKSSEEVIGDVVEDQNEPVAKPDEGPLEVEWEVTNTTDEEASKKDSKGAIKDTDEEDEDQMSLF